MKRALILLQFFLSLYLLTAQGSIQTSDGMSMYLLTQSIAERATVSIESERADILSKGEGERYYSKYGFGQPLLAVPFYLAGVVVAKVSVIPKRFSTLFMVSLFNPVISSLVCFVLFLCALEIGLTQRVALFLSCAYGISTTAWHYSQDFMSEPLTTLFLLGAFYFVLKALSGSHRYYLYSGCAAGFAFLVRPASLVAIPCYLIYIIVKKRGEESARKLFKGASFFLSGFIPFLLMYFLYNFLRFGSIVEAGYGHGFTTPLWVGVVGHLFTPGKSIFLYNPILIIAVIGFYDFIKARPHEALLVGLVFIGHLILYSKWECWMGGMCWGSRFLLVTFPYLIIASGFLLLRKKRRWWKAFMLLLSLGFIVQIPAVLVNPSRYYYTLRLQYKDEMMDQLIYTPKNSPILGQWEEVKKVIGNLRDREYLKTLVSYAKSQRSFIGQGDEEVLNCGLALNVPNFWWFYLYLYGFPLWVISGVLCLLIFCISLLGYRSYEACKG